MKDFSKIHVIKLTRHEQKCPQQLKSCRDFTQYKHTYARTYVVSVYTKIYNCECVCALFIGNLYIDVIIILVHENIALKSAHYCLSYY